jgi:hypothetical protein
VKTGNEMKLRSTKREQAWAEYKRVTAAAFAEYEMIAAPAFAEYAKVVAAALAEYAALEVDHD